MHHWRVKVFECTPLLQRPTVDWLQNVTGLRCLHTLKPLSSGNIVLQHFRSAMKSKSLSLSEHVWLTLIRQLAQAISYLHDTGFIHRDIKGDNVLVSLLNSEHRAILIDFGKCIHLSAAGNHLKHLTPSEQKKYHQKHGHIAPEIVSGASPPSFASDIYSFGQLVYAVGTFIDHHFLRALGKRCCHDDATMRPELNHIVDELKVPVQVVSD